MANLSVVEFDVGWFALALGCQQMKVKASWHPCAPSPPGQLGPWLREPVNRGVLFTRESRLRSVWAQSVWDPLRDSQAIPGSVQCLGFLAQTPSLLEGGQCLIWGSVWGVCVYLACGQN